MIPKSPVSIVRYKQPLESVRKAIALCRVLDHLPKQASVFIKPNIDGIMHRSNLLVPRRMSFRRTWSVLLCRATAQRMCPIWHMLPATAAGRNIS